MSDTPTTRPGPSPSFILAMNARTAAPVFHTARERTVEQMIDELLSEEGPQDQEPPNPNTASGMLLEAAGIVDGQRNITHGEKERSFVAIADMWTAYLQNRKCPEADVRAQDVAQMMVLMKMMRVEWGGPARDHFVDAAGYSAIAGELAFPKVERG